MVTKKIDHFYEVQRQMHAIVEKRARLQRNAGQKLVHCKLRGNEGIAEEFKQLVKLKSLGTYYAVKEAQMQPLIANNTILPSKEVQSRIEGTEREIFSLLSADNVKSEAINYVQKSDITLSNCLELVNEKLNILNNKLQHLSLVEAELDEKDVYTNDGFLKRDVEMKENMLNEKAQLESQTSALETRVQQSTSLLEEEKMQLSAAEGKITGLKNVTSSKKEDIQIANAAYREARDQCSILREERNMILCKTLLQRKALKLEMPDDLAVKATESLHTKKEDIDKLIRERSETLKMLKLKEADLDAEEKNLEVTAQSHQAELEQVSVYNCYIL